MHPHTDIKSDTRGNDPNQEDIPQRGCELRTYVKIYFHLFVVSVSSAQVPSCSSFWVGAVRNQVSKLYFPEHLTRSLVQLREVSCATRPEWHFVYREHVLLDAASREI